MAERGGQSGNDNASRGREFRQALTRAMGHKSGGKGWRAKLDDIASKLIDAAIDGESWAIQEVANRIDGKPPQAIEHSGSLVTQLTREQMIARLTEIHSNPALRHDDGAIAGSDGTDGSPAGE